ncbi:MAG: 4-hydroxythreonine-4-phosphate dehydrogenase PdxA [Alphaproteobacteria bacterium]
MTAEDDGIPRPAPIALTMGEPAGIGGETTLMAWRRRTEDVPCFFTIDDPDRLGALAERLKLDVPIASIDTPDEAVALFAHTLPVLAENLPSDIEPGRPDATAAPAVLRAIDRAVELTMTGRARAMVTNPIHKATLYEAGFTHPGHTEYLGDKAGLATPPVMMLACASLRVVPVTIHLPLRQAIDALSGDAIVHCGQVCAKALEQSFGIAAPRIAVAGLNPHAGEGGHLGVEDGELIAPAIARLREGGIDASGPFPADTLFHEAARRRHDAVLCMYHDQALIPIKTIDFDGGVNVTLGLPFIRTSPDHGTAFDIAGTGRASPESLMAALRMADLMAANRNAHATHADA